MGWRSLKGHELTDCRLFQTCLLGSGAIRTIENITLRILSDSTVSFFPSSLSFITLSLPVLSPEAIPSENIARSYLFPSDVWTHGDFISIHPLTLSIILHGRADGVLNPSGIRFGSAEIYNIVDTYFGGENGEIEDSVCIGQRRPQDADVNLPFSRSLPSISLDRM